MARAAAPLLVDYLLTRPMSKKMLRICLVRELQRVHALARRPQLEGDQVLCEAVAWRQVESAESPILQGLCHGRGIRTPSRDSGRLRGTRRIITRSERLGTAVVGVLGSGWSPRQWLESSALVGVPPALTGGFLRLSSCSLRLREVRDFVANRRAQQRHVHRH